MYPASDPDPIYQSWLEYELPRALELADDSDILEFIHLDDHHFVAKFECRGLVYERSRSIVEHDHFEIGIHLASDYLRQVKNPLLILELMMPRHTFHPNVREWVLCIGPIHPGTSLVSLLYRSHAVLTFQEYATLEPDSLNTEACQWARNHSERFPIDDRPIKRRTRSFALDGLEIVP